MPDPISPWITPAQAQDLMTRGSGQGVKIAVLDSGIETAHPDLQGLALADDWAAVVRDMKLVATPGGGGDLFGHGTAIAGILRRVAPAAAIGSFRVLGVDQLRYGTAIICEAARQAIERGYHILNCSFACRGAILQHKAWVDQAYVRGVHVVAACDNLDFSAPVWPGHFASVITVDMARAEGDLFYRRGSLVEFLSHGVEVEVPWAGGTRKRVTGSSFAAPHVAGLLARLLAEAPGLRPLQAKALLQHAARPWPHTQPGRP